MELACAIPLHVDEDRVGSLYRSKHQVVSQGTASGWGRPLVGCLVERRSALYRTMRVLCKERHQCVPFTGDTAALGTPVTAAAIANSRVSRSAENNEDPPDGKHSSFSSQLDWANLSFNTCAVYVKNDRKCHLHLLASWHILPYFTATPW